MPRRTSKSRKREKESTPQTEVIVDFIFEEGLFFISIRNIGDRPVFEVAVKFNKKIFGVEGKKEVSALPLFKNIEFLAPQKEIVTFLDTSVSYFGRKQPTRLSVKISYRDSDGIKHVTTIRHDLEIYKEIGYIRKSARQTQSSLDVRREL